jgi:PA-IL-like protein
MDVQQQSAGTHAQPAEPRSGAEPDAAAPPAEPAATPAAPLDEADNLNRLSKILLAVVPALTVALAAVGSATGGLARMFRDQTGAARASIGLIFLSFALAALARRTAAAGGQPERVGRLQRLRGGMLLLSGLTLVVGIAWAFDAQISVMGRGQAPAVSGSVTPSASGDLLDATVVATGVKSSNRIVVFAYESSDENGDTRSTKVPLYYSKSGPDADGRVDVHVIAQVPASNLQAFPYVFVTAVLGEDQRDCDGALIDAQGPAAPTDTACLTLQRPGASAQASSTSVSVPGTLAWTDTGLSLAQGEGFTVHATGQVSYGPASKPVGPGGATDPHPGQCVLPGPDHHAGLIARIVGPESGAPFLVGSDYQGTADRAGQLQLGINDVGVQNNAGAFQADIQVASQ